MLWWAQCVCIQIHTQITLKLIRHPTYFVHTFFHSIYNRTVLDTGNRLWNNPVDIWPHLPCIVSFSNFFVQWNIPLSFPFCERRKWKTKRTMSILISRFSFNIRKKLMHILKSKIIGNEFSVDIINTSISSLVRTKTGAVILRHEPIHPSDDWCSATPSVLVYAH